jgi:Tol biopolymer transport system component
VYDLSDGSSVSFSTSFSSMATFSPDGSQLLYPALVAREGSVRTLLHVADVASGQVTQLQGLDDQAQEALAGWTPDGTGIVVAIRSDGNTKTPGRQLFRMNRNDGRMTPLLVDDGYDHSAFVWEPGGERLLVQRSRVWSGAAGAPTVDRRPELVLLHPADTQPRLLAANAFAPRWVP